MPAKVQVKVRKKRAVAQVRGGMRRNVAAAGLYLHSELVKGLTGKRTGRKYYHPQRSQARKFYRASKPGEMPAERTGDLKRSVIPGPLENTRKGVRMRVGSRGLRPPYGRILQTKKNKKGRRRWLTMTLDRIRPKLIRILSRA